MKSSRQLIREIDRGSRSASRAASIKGDLKVLDESDYQRFSALLEISDGCERDGKLRLFLIEKRASYKNYDFWPQDERLEQARYKRERNKLLLALLNRTIDLLIKLRDALGQKRE